MLPRPSDDDILMILDECGWRFVAWRHALAHLGATPDPDEWLAVLDLELATDRWRDTFLAAIARRGWTLDQILEAAA
jgi:hypothetical protein